MLLINVCIVVNASFPVVGYANKQPASLDDSLTTPEAQLVAPYEIRSLRACNKKLFSEVEKKDKEIQSLR